MALKRQFDMTSLFSMASMTDVIFLLLIFFMVTSTFVFPTALEISLPQSSQQTALKPTTRIYVDAEKVVYTSFADSEPQPMNREQLAAFLQLARSQDPEGCIAVYADEEVPYGTLVEILDIGSRHNLKLVLATKPAPSSARPH